RNRPASGCNWASCNAAQSPPLPPARRCPMTDDRGWCCAQGCALAGDTVFSRTGKTAAKFWAGRECMRRLLSTGALVIGLLCVDHAQAGWREFWHRTKVDFHRNNAWPEPFQQADRAVTREPFAIMA